MLSRALELPTGPWAELAASYELLHTAVRVLNNAAGDEVLEVRRQYRQVLRQMAAQRQRGGALAAAWGHFLKVTRSYWSGLFRCYEVPELPRTNNDLEQCFGGVRYHERRTSGRKTVAPGLVVRGPVRVMAVVWTRIQPPGAEDLRLQDPAAWRQLRTTLEYRHEARRQQRRFRRNPAAYLHQLEEALLQPSLPT